ncbi:MAG TPA: hypothetical protein VEG34_05580 [Thermoanaerobaculia bacterium]|nr:hypothetical protein [Thermoanaerobaculia bacterium]
MSAGAIIFMTLSWTFVLGLTFWSFARILRSQKHFDPDGIGPAQPPVPGKYDDTRPDPR